MLKPLIESEISTQEFVIVDIENQADGSPFLIITHWRDHYGADHYYECEGWSAWIAWYIPISAGDKKFRQLWAHCGGQWDWLSLMQWMMEFGHHHGMKFVAPESKVIVARITLEFAGEEFQISLTDSYELFHCSIDAAGKKFTGSGKHELPDGLPFEYWERGDREIVREYCRIDCRLLRASLEQFLLLIRDRIARIDRLPNTMAGLALRIFRTLQPSHPVITTPWDRKLIGSMADSFDEKGTVIRDIGFLREGIRGGRCQLFEAKKQEWSGVNIYDINSMYASVMIDLKVPISARGAWVGEGYEIKEEDCGVYEVDFEQENHEIPAVVSTKNGSVYRGRCTLYSPEIASLRSVGSDVRILRGFRFSDTANLFRSYVEKIYSIRLSEKDNLVAQICKQLLASLWGKFGQRQEQESLVAIRDINDLSRLVRSGAKIRSMNRESSRFDRRFSEGGKTERSNRELPVYGCTEFSRCNHSHPAISGMVASAARAKLYSFLRAASATGRLLYTDTDSIHLVGRFSDGQVGSNLGQIRQIYHDCEAVYIGQKCYALRYRNGEGGSEEKVVAKGIRIGGRFGAKIGYEDMLGIIYKRRSIVAGFRSGTTVREMIQGDGACSFQNRNSTIG